MRAGLDEVAGCGAPIYVGVSTAAAARRAGRRGLGLFLSGAFSATVVAEMVAEHRRAWENAGAVGERPPVGLLRNVWLADSAAAQARAREWVRSSYVVYAGLGWTADQAGMDFSAQAEASMDDVEQGALIGPANRVAEELARYEGVDQIVCRIGYDLPPRSAVHEVMERIATELQPLLRDVAVSPRDETDARQ